MRRGLAAVAIVLATATAAHAGSISVGAARDNTIYAESDTLSNGAGQRLFAGRNGPGFVRRALVMFDLDGLVPSGAGIDSVRVQVTLVQTSAGTRTVALHRLLADWGESTSAAGMGEGGGAPAAPGDATWSQRFHGAAQPWAAPGGDFETTASAGRPVGAAGVYVWRSPALAADVALWLQHPSSNFGWELVGNETDVSSAKAFSSRQAIAASDRPVLTVYYTAVPSAAPPVAAGLRLLPVRPNPFNPSSTIRYQVPRALRVHLAVYDVRGRVVRVLADGIVPRGDHEVTWRGDDVRGLRVASGIYLVKLEAGGAAPRIEKAVLLK